MLQVKNLSFNYQNKEILKDICFSINQGEIIALIGPNGSGKSTLLRASAGFLRPKQGVVLFENQHLHKHSRKWVSRNISFLPQNLEKVNHITVWELVSRGRSPYHALGWILSKGDQERIEWAISYMNLQSLQNRPLQSLSGGERQRAWIAMILAQDTKLVLLDEPVTYLDMKYQWELLNVMKKIKQQYNKSFIVVLHDLQHALAVADRFIVMKEGKIYASGEPTEIVTPHLVEDVFEISAKVHRLPEYSMPFIIPSAVG